MILAQTLPIQLNRVKHVPCGDYDDVISFSLNCHCPHDNVSEVENMTHGVTSLLTSVT